MSIPHVFISFADRADAPSRAITQKVTASVVSIHRMMPAFVGLDFTFFLALPVLCCPYPVLLSLVELSPFSPYKHALDADHNLYVESVALMDVCWSARRFRCLSVFSLAPRSWLVSPRGGGSHWKEDLGNEKKIRCHDIKEKEKGQRNL